MLVEKREGEGGRTGAGGVGGMVLAAGGGVGGGMRFCVGDCCAMGLVVVGSRRASLAGGRWRVISAEGVFISTPGLRGRDCFAESEEEVGGRSGEEGRDEAGDDSDVEWAFVCTMRVECGGAGGIGGAGGAAGATGLLRFCSVRLSRWA